MTSFLHLNDFVNIFTKGEFLLNDFVFYKNLVFLYKKGNNIYFLAFSYLDYNVIAEIFPNIIGLRFLINRYKMTSFCNNTM